MRQRFSTSVIQGLFGAALGLTGASVQAETLNCTPVTELPAVIADQGVFCFTDHLATSAESGNAIEITANNVTLDLNGRKLGGKAAGTDTLAVGVYSEADNVTVKNGIVRGFSQGLVLKGRGAVVRDLLVDQNTQEGIRVEGQGALVERNQVVDTGGSVAGDDTQAYAIVVSGPESLVRENMISGLTAVGNGYEWGVYLGGAALNSTVRDNVISDADKPLGTGYSAGVRAGNTSNVVMIGNSVSNMDYGLFFYGVATGLYSGNAAAGCTTPFSGGTAGAGNAP